jgi:3-oxoacyl-[acyl-carrier-protein] synthase II
MSAGPAREPEQEPVMVTGLGVVSGLGVGTTAHFRRLLAGEAGVAPLCGRRWRGLPVHFQVPVPDFDPRHGIRDRMLRKLLQPSGAYAVVAAGEALADAGLTAARDRDATGGGDRAVIGGRDHGLAGAPDPGPAGARGPDSILAGAALYFGSVSYELPSDIYVPALRAACDAGGEFSFERFGRHGTALVDPLLIVKGLPNAALCGIAIEHGIQGPNANFAGGAVGGLQAVAAAAAAIRRGDAELALAGGADSLLQPEHLIDHALRGRLWPGEAPRAVACRPFAAGRQGYLPGAGAAVVVLESAAHARARGATVHAELLGAGETSAAGAGDAAGERAGREALAAAAAAALAGAGAGEPDALFGEGLGTVADDRREAWVARELFGDRVPLTAASGALGHAGAASAIIAFAHAVFSLARGWLPPTLGCDEPDRDCPVNLVRRAERRPLRGALVWASDEGRKNVALTCRRPPAAGAGRA